MCFNITKLYITMEKNKSSKTQLWLVIGVVVLIALLIIWLTIADFWGDTDVAAAIVSPVSTLTNLLL